MDALEVKKGELIDAIEGGYADEASIDWFLQRYILTDEQKDFLRNNGLSYSIIVNGRYECIGTMERDVAEWMRSVNDAMGYKLFITV